VELIDLIPERKSLTGAELMKLYDHYLPTPGARVVNPALTAAYLLIYSALKDREGEKLSQRDVFALAMQLSPASLDYLADANFIDSVLDEVDGRRPKKLSPKTRDKIKGQAAAISDEITKSDYMTSGVVIEPGISLTLREVHPQLAILRGFVGNDCSTALSPGFQFTPYDRYFYVYRGDGTRLGYVGMTMVSAKGAPTIFLHTIQGPDFTSAETVVTMKAIDAIKAQLGAEHVFMGMPERIHSNINFWEIKSTMEKAVANVTPESMTWFDAGYRATIHRYGSTLQYDDPEMNRFGRPLGLGSSELGVEVHTRAFEFPIQSLLPNEVVPYTGGPGCSLFELYTY
jgi:hypothetical protein